MLTNREAAEAKAEANAEEAAIERRRKARELEERRQNGRMWLETYHSRWLFYTKQASRALDRWKRRSNVTGFELHNQEA